MTQTIEVLVVRDPDGPCDVTVWIDGFDVTHGPRRSEEVRVTCVDAGAGWDYTDWRESAQEHIGAALSPAASAAIQAAYADPPGVTYIDGWPREDQ